MKLSAQALKLNVFIVATTLLLSACGKNGSCQLNEGIYAEDETADSVLIVTKQGELAGVSSDGSTVEMTQSSCSIEAFGESAKISKVSTKSFTLTQNGSAVTLRRVGTTKGLSLEDILAGINELLTDTDFGTPDEEFADVDF
jgi:hypothetical protein